VTFDEQRKNFDLAFDADLVLVDQLLIGKKAEGLRSNSAPDARFLIGFARRRLCRFKPLDRPALGDDPAFGSARGDEKDFQRCSRSESLRERGILDAERERTLALTRFTGNLNLSSSPVSPDGHRRLVTRRRVGSKWLVHGLSSARVPCLSLQGSRRTLPVGFVSLTVSTRS
jgi:hypothetical protein